MPLRPATRPRSDRRTYCFDIFERKALADAADIEHGRACDPLPNYVKEYMVQVFGVPKMARAELQKLIASLDAAVADKKEKPHVLIHMLAMLLGLAHEDLCDACCEHPTLNRQIPHDRQVL